MPLEKPLNMYFSHEMLVLAAVGVDVGAGVAVGLAVAVGPPGALVETRVNAVIGPPAWVRRADVGFAAAVAMLMTMLDALAVSFTWISAVTMTEPDVRPVKRMLAGSILMSAARALRKSSLLNVSTVPGSVNTA